MSSQRSSVSPLGRKASVNQGLVVALHAGRVEGRALATVVVLSQLEVAA